MSPMVTDKEIHSITQSLRSRKPEPSKAKQTFRTNTNTVEWNQTTNFDITVGNLKTVRKDNARVYNGTLEVEDYISKFDVVITHWESERERAYMRELEYHNELAKTEVLPQFLDQGDVQKRGLDLPPGFFIVTKVASGEPLTFSKIKKMGKKRRKFFKEDLIEAFKRVREAGMVEMYPDVSKIVYDYILEKVTIIDMSGLEFDQLEVYDPASAYEARQILGEFFYEHYEIQSQVQIRKPKELKYCKRVYKKKAPVLKKPITFEVNNVEGSYARGKY